MAPPEPGGPHADPDDLVAVALGHGPAATGREGLAAHLRGCDGCRDDLAALRRVVASARDEDVEGPRLLPPPRVWDAVAAATGVTAAPRPEALEASLVAGGRPERPPGSAAAPRAAGPLRAGAAIPVPAPRRPARWRSRALAAAAAAGLLAGGLLGGLVARATGGDGAGPAGAVAARADLGPVGPGLPPVRGSAELLGTGGQRRLLVSTAGLPSVAGSAHEVWLMDPANGARMPLGFLSAAGTGPTAGFAVPAGVDLGTWSVVDISAEPLDGQAGRSRASELRGRLRA